MPPTLMLLTFSECIFDGNSREKKNKSALHRPTNRRASSLRDARHTKRPISLPVGPQDSRQVVSSAGLKLGLGYGCRPPVFH